MTQRKIRNFTLDSQELGAQMPAVSILRGAMLSPKLHLVTGNVSKRIMNVYLYSVM